MRILFITNRFPGLLKRGDQMRAYHQIRHLARRHAITLLAFDEAPPDSPWPAEMAACCERVITARRPPLGTLLRLLGALAGKRPFQVAMYDAVPAGAGLEGLLNESRFDLAHIQLARLGPMVARLAPLPCVVDFVDALSLNMARRAQLDRGPLSWVARSEAARLAIYERALCAQVAGAAICALPDRAAIGNFTNLHIVGNGVDLERFPFVAPQARGAGVVFIGNLGYFPNVDAASWFAAEVMPLLTAAVPAARIKLVGARPAASLHRIAANTPGVELVGPVPEVQPFLTEAAVAVAPLRAGSGQQLKILEAMAAGTPVVATSLSAAGLDAINGQHLLVADDARAMAEAIARLIADSELSMRLARNARTLVETRYSWERSASELERIWLSVVSAGAAAASLT